MHLPLNPPEYYMYDMELEENSYDTPEPENEFIEATDKQYDKLDNQERGNQYD